MPMTVPMNPHTIKAPWATAAWPAQPVGAMACGSGTPARSKPPAMPPSKAAMPRASTTKGQALALAAAAGLRARWVGWGGVTIP